MMTIAVKLLSSLVAPGQVALVFVAGTGSFHFCPRLSFVYKLQFIPSSCQPTCLPPIPLRRFLPPLLASSPLLQAWPTSRTFTRTSPTCSLRTNSRAWRFSPFIPSFPSRKRYLPSFLPFTPFSSSCLAVDPVFLSSQKEHAGILSSFLASRPPARGGGVPRNRVYFSTSFIVSLSFPAALRTKSSSPRPLDPRSSSPPTSPKPP